MPLLCLFLLWANIFTFESVSSEAVAHPEPAWPKLPWPKCMARGQGSCIPQPKTFYGSTPSAGEYVAHWMPYYLRILESSGSSNPRNRGNDPNGSYQRTWTLGQRAGPNHIFEQDFLSFHAVLEWLSPQFINVKVQNMFGAANNPEFLKLVGKYERLNACSIREIEVNWQFRVANANYIFGSVKAPTLYPTEQNKFKWTWYNTGDDGTSAREQSDPASGNIDFPSRTVYRESAEAHPERPVVIDYTITLTFR